ncbi:TPA: hypothetical protein ACHSMM_004490 [Yersinia enterocolitica]
MDITTKGFKIYGEAGHFSGSYHDDGTHDGQALIPCPWCPDSELAVCNTHTPVYWVECLTCGAERSGDYIEGAETAATADEALAMHREAFLSAVNGWNTRNAMAAQHPGALRTMTLGDQLAEALDNGQISPAEFERVRDMLNEVAAGISDKGDVLGVKLSQGQPFNADLSDAHTGHTLYRGKPGDGMKG